MNEKIENGICGIYMITCTKPDKEKLIYVGQSSDIKQRRRSHRYALKAGRHINQYMQNAYHKYGLSSFSVEVVETCSKDELNKFEDWWLDEIHGRRGVMNIGRKSDAPLRGHKFSQAHRDKIAAAHRGENHYMFGKSIPEENRRKISEGGLGLKRSQSTKDKISAANSGERNSMFGKCGTQNHKSRPVVGFPINGGTAIRYASASLAAKNGFMQSEITRSCKGGCIVHRGHIWEYDIGENTVPLKKSGNRFSAIRSADGSFKKWEKLSPQ